MKEVGEHALVRWWIVSGIGAVYAIAFASLYAQLPGLYGCDGLLPMLSIWDSLRASMHVQGEGWELVASVLQGWLRVPSLLWLHELLPGVSIDHMMDMHCLVGFTSGALMAVGVHHALLSVACFTLYLSVVTVGQTFLSFQWDILLLEAGALCILLCPWCRVLPSLTGRQRHEPHPAALWMMRWLAFRLLFMSGVVKITSQCPTWHNLTAMSYHYATTCLPTPLAWWAHNMPLVVHQLGTWFTFIAEIPLPFLLLSPWPCTRIICCIIQITLQIFIMLTGNYTFFNLLTVVILLGALDDTALTAKTRIARFARRPLLLQYAGWILFDLAPQAALVCGVLFISGKGAKVSLKSLQEHELVGSPLAVFLKRLHVKPSIRTEELSALLEFVINPLIVAVAVLIVYVSAKHAAHELARRRWIPLVYSVAISLVCAAIFLGTIPGLHALHPRVAGGVVELPVPVMHAADVTHKTLQRFRVVNEYGLFRRMTGVGEDGQVARPEIIIQVLPNVGSNAWIDLHFPFKPGNLTAAPSWVAPHQPRLDWQMWFAALGSYQHNPWFVHLMHKILEGSSSVLGLLQVDDMGLTASPPHAVRAVLKHYDFTADGKARAWWREISSNQLYFPEIERENPSLLQVIEQLGWRHLEGSCISRQRCSVRYLCNALSYIRASFDQNYHLVRPLSWGLLLILTSRGLLWR